MYQEIKVTRLLVLLSLLGLVGCKGADIAQFESLGSRHKITCYSAGTIVYDGESTGNISNEEHSDGIYWKDSKTGMLVESTVPCLVIQE